MTGFDNGTTQGGVFFQAKQFGSILRGFGAPVPQAGLVGDLYIDVQSWFLYAKRSPPGDGVDPWGHYLFQVPATYRATLKWFSASQPTDDIGVNGDYCLLWSGFANYGAQPSIFGPRGANYWPENGTGADAALTIGGDALPAGLSGEGTTLPYSVSTQLVVVGLSDEFILAIPILADVGTLIAQQGLQSGPLNVAVVPNPLYAAQDQHTV